MKRPETGSTIFMQRVKAQSDVLVPLLRKLRSELGEDAANALIYPVIRTAMKEWVDRFASRGSDSELENWRETSERLDALFEGDVQWEMLADDQERIEFNVTGCRYARFFRQLNEPELGEILTCEIDNHIADLSASDVSLSRTETIMKGANHCPFRYRLSPVDGSKP